MTDGFMHIAINAAKDDQPNGIWHFGFLVPSLDPINAITPVHKGETAPGRHAENYIIDPQGNRIDVVLDMWPTRETHSITGLAGIILRRQRTYIRGASSVNSWRRIYAVSTCEVGTIGCLFGHASDCCGAMRRAVLKRSGLDYRREMSS